MNLKNYFTTLFCFCAYFVFAQPPSYVPTEGLKAWYGMNNTTDATNNGNTLTPFNVTTTTDRFGVSNSAYSFNGTSSYLTRSNFSQTFTHAGSFSVSIWMKKATSTGNVAIMSGTTASLNFIWLVQSNSSYAIYGTNKQQSAWFWTYATSDYVVNDWEHYVGVYSGNTMTFYRNGVLQGTTTNTHTNVSQASLPLWIGRGVSGSYFNGSLDDIGIWNRALTQAEITALYQGTLSVNSFSGAKVKVYPNPASEILHLEIDADNIGKPYQIIDDLGRIVARGTIISTTSEIAISMLKTGLYFIKIGDDSPVKFIKKY